MKQPNILFITTDYQAWEDGPDLGSPFLDMPALSRLCREGLVCANHYSSAPICMPARYSIVSGTYPHTHGVFDNRGEWLPEGSPLLMESLRGAGYQTIGVGKMHFHPIERMAGFDRRIIADQKEGRWIEDDYARFIKAHGFSTNRIHKKQGPDEIPAMYDWPEEERFHMDHYVGEQTMQVVDELGDEKPWFLWTSFNGPHSPWDAPKKYKDPYREMDLPAPRWREGELYDKPHNHTASRYIYSRAIMHLIDKEPHRRDEIFREMRIGHYANLTMIDRQVERVLNRLEAKGVLDNTIVIWSADHGSLLGDHDLIHKSTHYERSCHTPFVIRWPGRVQAGMHEAFTTHVDIMPTLLSAVGAESPDGVEGTNLLPQLLGEEQGGADCAFMEIRNDVSLITHDYKLNITRGPRFASEHGVYDWHLVDRKRDPDELHNFSDDPAYAEVKGELLERLFAFRPALRDEVLTPEPEQTPWPDTLTAVQGEHVGLRTEHEPIPLGGKGFELSVAVEPGPDEAGVIAEYAVGPHGFLLELAGGDLRFCLTRFGVATELRVVASLPQDGATTVTAKVDREGGMELLRDGTTIGSRQAPGGIPALPGRAIRETAGDLRVGFCRDRQDPRSFTGTLTDFALEVIPNG